MAGTHTVKAGVTGTRYRASRDCVQIPETVMLKSQDDTTKVPITNRPSISQEVDKNLELGFASIVDVEE